MPLASDAPCHAPGLPCVQVLYTDVDTIFMEDINSCSLPSPRILSAAGEVTTLFVRCAACSMNALFSAGPLNSMLLFVQAHAGMQHAKCCRAWQPGIANCLATFALLLRSTKSFFCPCAR